MGGSKRANAYANYLKSDIVICYKQRSRANVVDKMTAIGEVEGKDIVLVDDMIDTGGTLTKAANMMMEKGAKSVTCHYAHMLYYRARHMKILKNRRLTELVVTDTIPLKNNALKLRCFSGSFVCRCYS